jgi:N-dimethylarginine dimethylaminohydrolase
MTRQMVSKPVFLMCPPEHFTVRYRINPWMQPEYWAEREAELLEQARAGWKRLTHTLEDLGASLVMLPPQEGLPDLVFTANAAVVLDGIALLARFKHPERTGEEPHVARFFADLQRQGLIAQVRELPTGVMLEGAGDCVWDATRGLFWMGWGQRSDGDACAAVRETFHRRVIPLELVDPRFYHLDTCLCPLEGGHVLYVPEAFSTAGLQQIEANVPRSMRIAVGPEDASRLAANAVGFGRHVVLSRCSAALRASLTAAGYSVHEVDIPQFALSGGSVCCLTLRLDRRSSGRRRQTATKGAMRLHDTTAA